MNDRPRIKARPTVYKGIQMRSRLEARFAGILDDIGVQDWEYEGDAFASGTTQYLPDFTIGAWGIAACWYIELKPYVDDPEPLFKQMRAVLDSYIETSPAPEADCVLALACPPMGDFLLAERHATTRDRGAGGRKWQDGPPERGFGCFVRGWAEVEAGETPETLPVFMWGPSAFDDLYDALQVGDAPVHLDWKYR